MSVCISGSTGPCLGHVVALRGRDGHQLWSLNTSYGLQEMNCGEVDVNKDGKMDCIGTGAFATAIAFDPRSGQFCHFSQLAIFFILFLFIYSFIHKITLIDWLIDEVRSFDMNPQRYITYSYISEKYFRTHPSKRLNQFKGTSHLFNEPSSKPFTLAQPRPHVTRPEITQDLR